MKKMMVAAAVAVLAVASYAMSLAEARGKTDEMIASPEKMTDVMKQLTSDDQKTFVADVNEAICRLPASAEEKSAKAVNVNRAALKGAKRDDPAKLRELVAVIFATVPVEALCVINENFAKDLFNRAADPTKTYTDEQYAKIAKEIVEAVAAKTAGSIDAAVRTGFAGLMMIRGSNGSPASLADELASLLGKYADIAKEEWFKEALRKPANYDPMLAGTAVEKAPDARIAAAIAGAQRHDVLLFAFFSGVEDPLGSVGTGLGDVSQIQSFDHDIHTRPRTMDDKPWNPDRDQPQPPKPYYGQTVPQTIP